MARKHDNYDWAILLLLLLGFKVPPGLGGTAPDTMSNSGRSSMTDDTTTGKNGGGSMDTATGANNKNQDPSGNKSTMQPPSITPIGAPDKGTPVTGPGDMSKVIPTYMPNAGVQAAQAQVNAIFAGDNTPEAPGVYYNPNLPSPDGNAGASVTTVVRDPRTGMYVTVTNNQYLFPMSGPSMAEMAKQPLPPGSMPPMMSQPMAQQVPLPNLTGGVLQSQNSIYQLMQTQPVTTPRGVQSPPLSLPAPSGTLPSPLPTHPSLLSGLENFGQAALNQLLNQGKNLTGLFNNLQNILPTIPGLTSPRPLPIEVL